MTTALVAGALLLFPGEPDEDPPPPPPAPTHGEPTCMTVKSGPIYFTSRQAPDIIRIEIGDGPCRNAAFRIRVTTPGGRRLYSFDSDLGGMALLNWLDPEEVALGSQKLVDRILAHAAGSRSWMLPPYRQPPPAGADGHKDYPTTRARYERFRTRRSPVFRHPTCFEEFRYLVYDPASGKPVTVLTEGY